VYAEDQHQEVTRHGHRHARLLDQQKGEGRDQPMLIQERAHRQAYFSPPVHQAHLAKAANMPAPLRLSRL
jgi:hypothetical protein